MLNKINLINDLIKQARNLGIDYVYTYDGGTFPYEINIKEIQVKNQFVYILENKTEYSYGFEKRYNVNRAERYGSLEDLNYVLRLIKREFNKAIKNN